MSSPRAIGGVLDDAFHLYRASLRHCWLAGAVQGLVSAGIAEWIGLNSTTPTSIEDLQSLLGSARLFEGVAAIGIATILLSCLVLRSVAVVAEGGQPSLGESLGAALRALPGALIGALVTGALTLAGTLLLVFPGIYVWNRLQLWIVAMMADGEGPFASMGTSWRLVGGHGWRVLSLLSVVSVLLFVAIAAVGLISALILVPLHIDPAMRQNAITLVNGLGYALAAPLVPAALVVAYRDLKRHEDGQDLAERVDQLTTIRRPPDPGR